MSHPGRTSQLILRTLLALGFLLVLSLPPRVWGAADQQGDRPELPLLVRLPDEVSPEQAPAFLASLGLEALRPIPDIHVWRARPLPDQATSLEDLRRRLAQQILWIEQDGLVHAQDVVPNDPYYATRQWNLPLIGMEQAWQLSQGDEVVIAIIDSGLDLVHPDLQARLWEDPGQPGVHGYDFVSDDAIPQDAFGHGTHVAGIAGAHTDNGIGISGVGWGVRLMAVRVLDATGFGTWSDVAEGIIYAANKGARVLNLSLGGDQLNQATSDAVAYARNLGCLVVAAAGNAVLTTSQIIYPAALEGVMAVGATTSADDPVLAWRHGPQMDVAAPGMSVFSTYWTSPASSTYGTMNGTSMATPHVSGLAALIWAYEPTLTAAQVTQIITSTAHDVYTPGWDDRTGWGRIDARAALISLVLPQMDHFYRFPLICRRTAP